ncbi:MAG: NTP transferase domain-containing protein, partial [Eggerthellaceae bacterium]|nr:NTP transferase domain-containing protein [Eggerthellaceae bacterium]
MLTKNQFTVLADILEHGKRVQREIAQDSGISLGSVNAAIRSCRAAGLISKDGDVTESGIAALEPYKVENAVIMAAGMSTRFAPISYERPKGVLRVKGEVLIERQIRQLQEAGINDIIVVVGYMKEQFFYLEDKFGVTIRINEEYAT